MVSLAAFLLKFKKYFLIILLFCVILIVGLYFNLFEYVVGRCLLLGNNKRPEIGLVWKVEHKKKIANDSLSKLIKDRFSLQYGSVSFANLLVSLNEGRGVMVSYAHFMDFYSQLPNFVANQIFSPYSLLKLSSESVWDSVYFEKKSNRIGVYLLDKNNIVLEQNTIKEDLIEFTSIIRPNFNGNIDEIPNLVDNIYPADVFFSALLLLPLNIQKAIISLPERLLKIDGELLQVGISNKIQFDNIEVGVEVENSQGCCVVFFQGKTNAVNSIKQILEKKEDSSSLLKIDLNRNIKR